MPKILLKDILVEIRSSLGRFLSITLIVALGVAFFAGIKASAPDMKNSADSYFDTYNVQDIQIYSTVGLDQDDIDAIEKIEGVEEVQGQFTIDALTRKGSQEQVVKVISMNNGQTMNVPRLISGRMPEEPDECIIEAANVNSELFGSYSLGDRIRLYSATDTPLSDTLEYTTYIIVGTAYNPNYLSYEKGTSTAGSGSVDTFIYIEESAVKADYYTEVDVTVANAKELDTYSDAYFDVVDPVVASLEAIADTRVADRIAKQQEKVDEARQEADEQLADAKEQLDTGQKELAEAAEQLQQGLEEILSNEALLASSKTQLESGWATYYSSKQQVEDGLAQVDAGIAQIQSAQAQLPLLQSQLEQLQTAVKILPALNNAISTMERLEAEYQDAKEQLDALEKENPDDPAIAVLQQTLARIKSEIDSLVAEFTGQPGLTYEQALDYMIAYRNTIVSQIGSVEQGEASIAQLEEAIAQIEALDAQLEELESTRSSLLAAQQQLESAYATLIASQSQLEEGQAQLDDARLELEEGQAQYDQGKEELDQSQALYDQEKEKADDQIAQAQEQVDDLSGEWYILDRTSHYSYRDYESCADRMDGIASVFPVFFYLVAALVCMTTMTRMVDEQRNEIGTLKALGYSKGQIAFKFLAYAGLASVLGCILGCSVGMVVFPYIIYSAWNVMYNLEQIRFVFQPGLVLLASLSVTAIVLAATLYSIYRELLEVPSQLMRPKAAAAGKKILLERIPWIWNRVSFMHKVTLRNLFRYKKRFFMTVVGIAGCSALLVAGFGLNDSISDIVPSQFSEIYHYDATVTADPALNPDLKEQIESIKGVQDVYDQEILSITLNYDSKDVTGYLNILEDPDSFAEFMTFIPMENSEENMKLDDKGVFISIKTAENMGLSVGDSISFETAGGQKITAEVTGIFDQYINHQIYVTKTLYDTWNVQETPSTTFLLVNESTESEAENEMGTALMGLEGVKSISFYSSLQENFLNMISSIKMVVVVLVLSAAMLAFVVLYNLSNVNISERMREIATIKVLGFTEKEVNQYINRESIILAAIGALCGLFVGIYLHNMIMNLAELDDIRFGRTINASSFGISLVLTMVFAAAVNWIMKFKLRKIEMVESLKAVE